MERKPNSAETDSLTRMALMGLFCGFLVAGCNENGDEVSKRDECNIHYEIVSTQGFSVVEKAMPKIRAMLIGDTPSDFHEVFDLYSQIDSLEPAQERYISYRFLLDKLGSMEGLDCVPRDRLRGLLSNVSVEVFVKLHEMNAPVKEMTHTWLTYIAKMDAEALWSKEELRNRRVDFVEKFVNDMIRLGFLKDAAERSEIETEFLRVIDRPLKFY